MIYNLFVSHSWNYNNAYDNLISLLEENRYFEFHDYSVPKDDPIHNVHTKEQLKNAIKIQMLPASCVIILAGVYASYSESIQMEIELAQELGKKIIAVRPWGAERVSTSVTDVADEIAYWNSSSIIKAIRGY